jgi:nucleoporin NUP42
MNDVLNNASNAGKFIEDAETKHPNRLDFTKVDGTKPRDQVIKEVESGNSLGGSSDFGQSNAFAKPTTAFGQPNSPSSFGQPTQPSSFGQPSGTFGQPAASAFGKPTIGFGQPSFGRPAQPVFGQPAQPAAAFGQPAKPTSVFGQPAPSAPVFGQPSQPVFGQAAQPSSAFGKPAFGSSGFGQPSALGAKNSFAAPSAATGFGQPSFGQSTPVFGQPAQSNSGFGQSSQSLTGFGQPAQSNPFGQPSETTQSNPFGKPSLPSPFSQPTATSSGFGQPATSTASDSTSTLAFGQTSTATPTFGQPPPQPSNPFGARVENKPDDVGNPTTSMFSPGSSPTTNSNPFGVSNQTSGLGIGTTQATRKSSLSEVAVLPPNTNSSAAPHPLTNKAPQPLHYTQTIPATAPTVTEPATGKLQRYRGRPVQYVNGNPCYERPDGRGWERIWFPQNSKTSEVVYLGRGDKIGDLVADHERYTDEITQGFAYLFEMGKFKDGQMPAVPPKREWCLYDF